MICAGISLTALGLVLGWIGQQVEPLSAAAAAPFIGIGGMALIPGLTLTAVALVQWLMNLKD